jgi:short-subunit dehydrogenase
MGKIGEATYSDWDWILGVNLGGVVNGLCTFLPRIRSRRQGGHVIATASAAGLFASENVGIYVGAKMAVVGIMEVLRAELASEAIGVTVVCPHLMRTHIYEHSTLRPNTAERSGYGPPPTGDAPIIKQLEAMSAAGMDPVEVAEHTLTAVLANNLYVIPFPELRDIVRQRCDAMISAMPDTVADPERLKYEAPTLQFGPYLEAIAHKKPRTSGT